MVNGKVIATFRLLYTWFEDYRNVLSESLFRSQESWFNIRLAWMRVIPISILLCVSLMLSVVLW